MAELTERVEFVTSENQLEKLRKEAAKAGVSVSELIRTAINELLRNRK